MKEGRKIGRGHMRPTFEIEVAGELLDATECPKCSEVKPFSEFHKDTAKPLGLQTYCKKCRSKPRKPKKEKPPTRGKGWNIVPVIDGMRTCTKCKESKPLEAFWKDGRNIYGYSTICKACKSDYRLANYKPRLTPPREILPERPCRSCGVVKPLEAFYPDARSYDKRSKDCRECYELNLFKGLGLNEFETE